MKLNEAQKRAVIRWQPLVNGALYTTTPPSQDDDMMALCDAGLCIGRPRKTSGQPSWVWELTEEGKAVLMSGCERCGSEKQTFQRFCGAECSTQHESKR